jgi:preprotein translocase subunit SecF
MFILKYKKIFFSLAGILILGAGVLIATHGMKLGVDFTGGSVLGITAQNLTHTDIHEMITSIPGSSVQSAGEHGYLIKTPEIDQTTKNALVKQLTEKDTTVVETQFNTIGPSVGSEIRIKTIISIVLISIFILLFVAWAFRNVARPVSSWIYGLIVIVVLIHDIIIPTGIFALLGREISTLFVIGILTILGVSINDTIVVFDRIRENLHVNETKHHKEDFAHTVGKSINQTFVRSLMTSCC